MEKIFSLFLAVILLASYSSAYSIVNMHEHIMSISEAGRLIAAMDENNITKAVLLGSPAITLYSNAEPGFKGYDKNNDELIKITEKYPDRFIAFPTIDPKDNQKLDKLKDYTKKGAKGLKLYSGHTDFYELALNDSKMHPVYSYLEENNIPIMFHVNGHKYKDEFKAVLNDFPDLVVICPHFCLLSSRIDELRELLHNYPNLYIDVSFGRDPFLIAGVKRLSNNKEEFKKFFEDYSDRILFGTDSVVTDNQKKTKEWLVNVSDCYIGMLEKEKYGCFLVEEELEGLDLSEENLKKIYEDNPKKIFSGKAAQINAKKDENTNFVVGISSIIIVVLVGLLVYFITIKRK